jgi:hypothetical protein
VDGDGGSSAGTTVRDFSVFRGGGIGAIPILMTTNNTSFGPEPLVGALLDNADPGFGALFPPKTLSFTTPSGSAGLRWLNVEVRQITNVISWLLNDTMVAQYANSFLFAYTNGNILIGYNDAFASTAGADNFAVFDNRRVETVPDLDGDGMADVWEQQYFGNTAVLPDEDADSDGVSNLQEFLAGTNPTNSASAFRFLGATKTNNDIRLDWTTVGGHNYVLQSIQWRKLLGFKLRGYQPGDRGERRHRRNNQLCPLRRRNQSEPVLSRQVEPVTVRPFRSEPFRCGDAFLLSPD